MEYKRLMAEAIDGKSYALSKMDVYLESLTSGLEQQSVERILRAPLRSFASAAVVLELRSGLVSFPWKSVVEDKSATIALGDWNAAETSKEALRLVVSALGDNINLRSVLAKGVKLDLPDGWASTALQWTSSDAVRAVPATAALVLKNCSSLTSLSLRSRSMPNLCVCVVCVCVCVCVCVRVHAPSIIDIVSMTQLKCSWGGGNRSTGHLAAGVDRPSNT